MHGRGLLMAAAKRRAAASGDPYLASIVSLLHFDGDLTDQKGITWTAGGNATATGTPSMFGSNALALDGSGDYIECPSEAWAAVFNGKHPFTAECWCNITANSHHNMIFNAVGHSSYGAGAIMLMISPSNQLQLYMSSDGSSWDMASTVTSTATVTDGVYSHVAMTYDGTDTFKVWLDGAEAISVTSSATLYYSAGYKNRIGAQNYSGAPNPYEGLIDEFRLTAVERYTAPFTPPAAAPANP